MASCSSRHRSLAHCYFSSHSEKMPPSTPNQALRKCSCSLIFFSPPFKSGVIKPQPMAEPSYWFYCREPRDILMMYCSINGNWWDRYWWRMVHFAAIHWVPVTLPVTHHLWKCCSRSCKLVSILLMLTFPWHPDERAIMITATAVCQASGWVFLNRHYFIYFLQQNVVGRYPA